MAQQTTSAIRGKVLDSAGLPLGNAVVLVVDERTGIVRSFTTNAQGTFLASRLPPGGPYRVTVNNMQSTIVENISVADTFNLSMRMESSTPVEEVVVTAEGGAIVDVAAGPAATFSSLDIENSVAFNRDIVDVYGIDPRLNIDNEDDGFEINCAGKHPRFNSVTLDGVSQNDRFGLNSNGYSTAVGMPFPFDSIDQIAVELAPFDVTYGGFSACNINAVTKSGSNEWDGNLFWEWTSDSLRGDELGGDDRDFSTPSFNENTYGFTVGGPLIQDRLFMFAAYEESERPRFLARGFDGSGVGVEREWFSRADHDRIVSIANNVYGYDPGGLPTDGAQESEKYMVRLDWNINESHNLAFIYNYFDGFQDRDSDGDSDEFEFANHFYTKGAESETFTAKLASNWTDAFSTEVFLSTNEMNDSQVTVGPQDFGDHQISIGRDTVYLGADDSRQANRLNTDSDFFKLSGQYLAGDHVITFGYESEELTIFNQFVQHARGGEYDYFDDSEDNPAFCADLDAQGRFDNPDCGLSGIDRFELGRPSRIYYGSGGGTNDPADAAANFSNTLNAVYIQDEIFFDENSLTVVAGLRYEWFDSDDRPNFNQAFTDANGGLRNDANIDGVDLIMPRLGFTWDARPDLSLRGGIGRYSGGNPNVWISNAWSNDGLTNVQLRLNNFGADRSVLDGSIPLTGNRPGFDIPQELFDAVAATTADNASDSRLVLIDPNYKQPNEWKFALGATYDIPWLGGIQMDVDYIHTELQDSAYYVDLSQAIVGQTSVGTPIYDYVNGRDNYMLTNSDRDASADIFSVVFNKDFDWGLETTFGYSYTEGEDISPMTSSTAGSNFDNTALLDINDPRPATSNYVVPHRFTIRASYANEFFGDLTTRFTAFAYVQEGQPQSYVMGSGDLEGDGFFGRHLLYVPDGPNDPNVVYADNFDQAAFFDFVEREGLGAGFVERNQEHARWSDRIDIRIDQELPSFFEGTRARLFLKVYNFGNLLNDDWGKVYDAQFFSVQVLNSSVDDQGRFVFERFRDRSLTDVLENRSLWTARLGLEINF
ncbi:MAG: carboxypeptidase regulatory-like domain-containing protein [Xanthomonadales bacterium]|nr:carboxypeptidase regulatory-like domain-containing protein [Xanthomonadales bacterium]